MHGELNYRLASEHVADLHRAAERERFARSVPRESFLASVIARVRGRERRVAGRAPARVSDAQSAPGASGAAAAKA